MIQNKQFSNILSKIEPIIQLALDEDIGTGDLTSQAILSPDLISSGRFVAKADGVIAGLAVMEQVFALLDDRISIQTKLHDGDLVTTGTTIATISGPGQPILSGERVALNFMQRMSGIATMTHQFMSAVAGTKAVILDTRKTAPGLRHFDKWAVHIGGGGNHRIGLYDMALIKENHIRAAGGITAAVERVRRFDTENRPIEVEVTNLTELDEALGLNLDRIMLDNMSLTDMTTAVTRAAGRVPLEASGNVTLATVAAIAQTGVDFISSGALTHSVTALDISLLFDQ
ncbi:MAG TPA: carboxylating nicotinate-nucleotide diphosphorylase [Anaerolineae bacterium]|nr:carboxylating nicotinate-nucleotide diphosphorylase [Anaerolineae bacterium]